MNIVAGETYQIDKEEHKREVEIGTSFAGEVEPQTEEDRQRHPAEVEETGEEVHYLTVVNGKELVGRQHSRRRLDSEKRFLGIIEGQRLCSLL